MHSDLSIVVFDEHRVIHILPITVSFYGLAKHVETIFPVSENLHFSDLTRKYWWNLHIDLPDFHLAMYCSNQTIATPTKIL